MTSLEIFRVSSYFSTAGTILIAVFCLLSFTKRPLHVKALCFYAVLGIFFDVAQRNVPGGFVNIVGNAFVLTEALLFCALYFFVIKDNAQRRWVLFLGIIYLIFYTTSIAFFESNAFSNIRSGRDLILIICAITFFYYLLKKLPEENLLKFPMFWINAAVIFYFSGTFLLSFFRDYIVTVLKDDTSGFWSFRNFFRFLFCAVLSYAAFLDWQNIRLKKV